MTTLQELRLCLQKSVSKMQQDQKNLITELLRGLAKAINVDAKTAMIKLEGRILYSIEFVDANNKKTQLRFDDIIRDKTTYHSKNPQPGYTPVINNGSYSFIQEIDYYIARHVDMEYSLD